MTRLYLADEGTDPYLRDAQVFPRLTAEMITRLERYGAVETVECGTFLFRKGQRKADFFVVRGGSVGVLGGNPGDAPFTTHGAGQFTGELDLFNERQVLVSAKTLTGAELLRIPHDAVRTALMAEPEIGEIVTRALILRRVGLIHHANSGVILVGGGHSGELQRLQRFLSRNAYPYHLIDIDVAEDPEQVISALALARSDLPAVLGSNVALLRNPTDTELADALGLTEAFDPAVIFDVAIVGAGPAGLASAVYAASEGLRTIVLERMAPGGQAGTSSKIENYLGFPNGISGHALAGRAQVQAQKFGASLAITRSVARLECDDRPARLIMDDGTAVRARSVVVASGARYCKLSVPGYAQFEGTGIHYAATAIEANLCAQEEVVVVGGGNSAGQAAVFLSRMAKHVHMLVRGPGLAATMSDYLVQRIHDAASITLHTHTEIVSIDGDDRLRRVMWQNRSSGLEETKAIAAVFVMIGAEPNTEWLLECLELDDKGFVCTGHSGSALLPFTTSVPGIFAAGDVRAGSVKRVASAVGEGSVVIQAVHRFLAETASRIGA